MIQADDMKVGNTFQTKNCGILKIIEYVNAYEVTVKFIATGYIKICEASDIRKGAMK